MVTVVTCPKCDLVCRDKSDLKKHLTKRYPCDSGKYECSICGKRFQQRSGRNHHKKVCKGPPDDNDPIVLLARIKALEEQQRETVEASAFEEISNAIQPVGIAHVADCIKPQVYFGEPGPLLKPVQEIVGNKTLIKLGESDQFPTRCTRHTKDFGGFRLLDSIVTSNPKHVETKLKDYLKVKHPMIKCKTVNKKYTDTEIISVETQEEYEEIVMVAKKIADDYASEVEAASGQRAALNSASIVHELESLRLKLRIAELEKQTASLSA